MQITSKYYEWTENLHLACAQFNGDTGFNCRRNLSSEILSNNWNTGQNVDVALLLKAVHARSLTHQRVARTNFGLFNCNAKYKHDETAYMHNCVWPVQTCTRSCNNNTLSWGITCNSSICIGQWHQLCSLLSFRQNVSAAKCKDIHFVPQFVCFYNSRAQCFAGHALLWDVRPGVWIRKPRCRHLSALGSVELKWQSRAVFQAYSPVQNKCSTSFVIE